MNEWNDSTIDADDDDFSSEDRQSFVARMFARHPEETDDGLDDDDGEDFLEDDDDADLDLDDDDLDDDDDDDFLEDDDEAGW